MNIYVVLAHPHTESFNHAIVNQVLSSLKEKGHDVVFHDLYKEEFNPILSYEEMGKNPQIPPVIQKHMDEVVKADGLIVIHPNWWGQPPAILKGWMDRVLAYGVAYRFSETGQPLGLLKARKGLVFNTSNTPEKVEVGVYGDPLENLWGLCTLQFCGVEQFQRAMFKEVNKSTEEQRKHWLQEVKELVEEMF